MNQGKTSEPIPRKAQRVPRWKVGLAWLFTLTLLGVLGFIAWPSPTPEQIWNEAKVDLETQRFDRALANLDRLRRFREPTVEDLLLRAEVELGRGQPDAALQSLNQVKDDHRLASQAQLLIGRLELRRHRLIAAEAGFLHALKLQPNLIPALRELVYIYGMQLRRPDLNRTFRALSAEVMLEVGEVYLWTLTSGVTWEPEEISIYLAKCVAADPTDRYSRLGLAESHRQQNHFAEAEKALAPLPPSDPDARAIRVRMAIDQSDDTKIDALLAEGPADHAVLSSLRGRLALARGEGPKAVEAFRIAQALDPLQRDAELGLGQALMMVGDAAAAEPHLAKVKKFDRLATLMEKVSSVKNRGDINLIRDLGEACTAVGRMPEARSWYKLAIRADPTDIRTQQGYARASTSAPVAAP